MGQEWKRRCEAVAGIEIGRAGETFRRVRPFGRELTGYEVTDLTATLAPAKTAGATVLVPPFASDGRTAALVHFPGGYIAEIHTPAAH